MSDPTKHLQDTPDLGGDFVAQLLDLLCASHPDLAERRAALDRQIRVNFGGSRYTVAKRMPPAEMQRLLLAKFRGNVRMAARALGISRATAYRLLNRDEGGV